MGSRLLPFLLGVAAFAAATGGVQRLALYLGLFAVPAAAAAAFVAVSDVLEGRPSMLRAVTSGVALTLIVTASAVRENAVHGAPVPPLAVYAVGAALVAYAVPVVAWVLEPLRLSRLRQRPAPVRVTSAP